MSSGEQVNVLHDQQGDILGEDNSHGGDVMYVTDNLGSVVASIDSSGHGVLTDPYTPYGLDAQPGSLDPMLTFTGALQDTVGGTTPGTGFLHFGNRWYRPPVEPNAGVGNETGPAHFTQPDSITQLTNPANANLYAYAADSPVNYVDPAGGDVCTFRPKLCGLSGSVGIEGGSAGEACAVGLVLGIVFALPAIIGSGGIAFPALTSLAGAGFYGGVSSGIGTYVWGCT